MKQTKPVEEMDCMDDLMFELEAFGNYHRDDCRSNFTYDTDETPEDCDCDMRGLKPFFLKAIATAVKEEKERTRQVVRQAQIAMEYIEDDEQADWCLARFDAMLDEDLKLQQPK